jgi:hypothetical protein
VAASVVATATVIVIVVARVTGKAINFRFRKRNKIWRGGVSGALPLFLFYVFKMMAYYTLL